MSFSSSIRRLAKPLASRKVRVALATVIAAYAAEYGLGVSEQVVFTILGVGAALILGIAHEDNGLNSSLHAPIVNALRNRLERAESAADVTANVEQLRKDA